MIAGPMTRPHADSGPAPRPAAAGPMAAAGSVGPAARAVACVPGPGGGEIQLVQTAEAPGGARRRRPAVLALDRPARRRPAAPPVRDVARGARAGPGGAGPGRAGRALADLLVRAGALAALAPSRSRAARDLAAWAARRRLPAAAGLAARAARRWPTRSCRTREAEAEQLVRLFGVDPAQGPGRAQRRRAAVRRGRPAAVPGAIGGRATSCSTSAGSSRGRTCWAWSGRRGGSGCRWWSSATPCPGHEAYAERCRREGGDRRPLAAAARPRRPAAGLGLRGGPGLRPAELVRDARPGRPGSGLAGCPVVVTPFGCTREYFGDRVELRPARPARRDRPGDCGGPGSGAGPRQLSLPITSDGVISGRTWPGGRRRSMTRSPRTLSRRPGRCRSAATATASGGGGCSSHALDAVGGAGDAALAAGPAGRRRGRRRGGSWSCSSTTWATRS